MDKVRVSAVSYTNTLPFLNGLKQAPVLDRIILSLENPSACAQKVIDDEADLGIIPVAALLSLPEAHIITDYCIGTEGAVDSVFIFSHKPIAEIETLYLDKQSRTSNGLARVLLKHHWKKEVEIIHDQGAADAFVLIGDRTFGQKKSVPFVYDLGLAWKEFTGLPFAFAVWVSNKLLPADFISEFNEALKVGVSNPSAVIPGLPVHENFDYHHYLTESLNYHLTPQKREAVEKYLELLRGLEN
ncbi:menaquinone biosynthesis protein [Sphingobacterium sp. SRCM116780]|uniref:menaquinone biosynthetic enzyme MqnA/MqnD family protein n=1 Tax=Sphingobacterium sp. SRCM116780 TaxID=2907623 RepID=UPI001F40FAEF|nr:menaquinone biosynthesis protein [Sphingobacterium sp. SRCM116780]UIR57636.1 menaquinone biosynthesis protein [Sphingobacterium sp. SRCM116780]